MALVLLLTALLVRLPLQEPAADVGLTPQQVQARIQELEGSAEGDDAARRDAIGLYGQALEALDSAGRWRAQALEYERATSEAPGVLTGIQSELASPPRSAEVPPDATFVQLQQLQARTDGELEAARKQVAELQGETVKRVERRTALPQELARLRGEMEAAERVLQAAPAEDPGPIERATRVLRQAQLEALRAHVRALQSELDSYEARNELLPLRRDLKKRRLDETQAFANALAGVIAERRRQEAERAKDRTTELSASALGQVPDSAEFRELGDEIAALGARRSSPDGPAAQLEAARGELVALRTSLDDLKRRFERTRSKVRVAGLTNAMGRILRVQYEVLPDEHDLRGALRHYREELSNAQLAEIQLEERRDDVADVEQQVLLLLERMGPTSASREELERVGRELLAARVELLDDLLQDYALYLEQLQELDRLAVAKLELTTHIRTYIEERILWVRSVEATSVLGTLPSVADARAGIAWLLDPARWTDALGGARAGGHPWLAGLVALLVLATFTARSWTRRRLEAIAPLVARHRSDRFALTLAALLLTAVVALPVSAALWGAARILEELASPTDVVRAVAAGLRTTGVTLYPLYFLLALVRSKGLAEAHFRWPTGSTRALRRALRAFLPLFAPLGFAYRVFGAQANEAWHDALGRTAFVTAAVVAAVTAYRVLDPRGKVLGELLRRNPNGLLERSRLLWYPASFLAPLSLAVASLAGYFYTAERFYERIRLSFVVGLLLLVVNSLFLRWLFSARRRLAVEQARQRAAARAAAASSGAATAPEGAPALDEDQVDIPSLDAKTRQLFRSGMLVAIALATYLLWVDFLPALKGLDRVVVYPHLEVRSVEALEEGGGDEPALDLATQAGAPNGASPPASGSATSAQNGGSSDARPFGSSMVPGLESASAPETQDAGDEGLVVTVADLALALLILILTAVAALNFPGLLEIALLQRLPLDAGARYAITTVSRYAIAIAGISSVGGALGIGWAKIQWLAAALTFGLAFGLQEIFANFISGLIILVERPVRLGDVVTVGNVEGQVTRIRMRATTITDWDRRELLVPNKEFITTQLINWTLSDPITRLVLSVGIAYGSDTVLATKLLLECASSSPKVLDEPRPSAIFRAFGESSLDFQLRIFIPQREVFPEVVHDVHTRIDQAFRKAGIEIAFPQRDLHVRGAEALGAALRGPGQGEEARG